MAKARRLCAGLPIVAMPDDARQAMLDRVAARAMAVLPSVEQVLLAIEEDDEQRPAVSPIAVILLVALALVLGVAVAALSTMGGSGGAPTPLGQSPLPDVVEPSFSAPPATSGGSPSPTPTSASPTPSPSPTVTAPASVSSSPSPTQTTAAPVRADIAISPHQGPRGTQITVRGTGWPPRSVVRVTYSGTLVSSTTSAETDTRGRFTAQVTASGTLPGSYTIRASDGARSATANFRQTS